MMQTKRTGKMGCEQLKRYVATSGSNAITFGGLGIAQLVLVFGAINTNMNVFSSPKRVCAIGNKLRAWTAAGVRAAARRNTCAIAARLPAYRT